MNTPCFRAKKIDSDDYVEGYYKPEDSVSQLFVNRKEGNYIMTLVSDYDYRDCEIDPTTLAIHFPDMLDSQGNKIFASLSEDGKGGDIMRCDEYFGVAKYIDCGFMVEYENCIESIFEQNFEVIGEIK